MGHRSIFGLAFVALGFGLFFAVAAVFLPPAANASVPTASAFAMIGALGSACATALRVPEERLAKLEDQHSSRTRGQL
jgi:hypothetical protein